jgi:hypothetical protein
VEQLRSVLLSRPFQPFAIVMRDGKRHRVTRQFQAGTNGTNIGIIDNKDQMTWFKMDDVQSIELIVSRRRGGRRGKSR